MGDSEAIGAPCTACEFWGPRADYGGFFFSIAASDWLGSYLGVPGWFDNGFNDWGILLPACSPGFCFDAWQPIMTRLISQKIAIFYLIYKSSIYLIL